MQKRFWFLGVVVVIIITSVIWTSYGQPKGEPGLDTVKVGYRAQVFYSPLFVGEDKGFFVGEGLKIEPVEFESTNQLTDALLAGRIDVALGGVNTFILFNIEEKSPGSLKIFSLANENKDNPSTYLLVKKDSSIQSITDLANKKIGAHQGSSIKILYNKLISANNLIGTTLEQMSPELELQALESGQVDAVIVIEPLNTVGAQKGISQILDSALFDKYFFENIPLTASVASASWAQNNSGLMEKMIRATNKSVDFIKQNPTETRKIISRHTSLPTEIADKVNLPDFLSVGSQEISGMNKLGDMLFLEKEIGSQVSVEDMFLK